MLQAGAGVAGIAATGLSITPALAQGAYPTRPITFICPWPAGGTADATMRVLTRVAAQLLGQPIVFENRAGASGMIGARAIAIAQPDGYTIGQLPISITRFSQLGTVSFDPLKNFTFIARTSGQTFGMVVRPDSPYKTLADLVAAAKANPGKISYATAGIAGATHVGMEEFCLAAGIKMNHIPYKGGSPALMDTLAGMVDVLADSSSWAPHVEQGKLRLLATWGAERPARFKNSPTLKNAGYDVVVDAPNGIGAPAGLPPHIVAKLSEVFHKAVMSPQFKEACDKIDTPLMYLNGEDYRKYVLSQYIRDKRLIDKLNLKEQIKNG
nr:tripartite tricarboxylate transporter substrate binding protein [Massilia niastensis]